MLPAPSEDVRYFSPNRFSRASTSCKDRLSPSDSSVWPSPFPSRIIHSSRLKRSGADSARFTKWKCFQKLWARWTIPWIHIFRLNRGFLHYVPLMKLYVLHPKCAKLKTGMTTKCLYVTFNLNISLSIWVFASLYSSASCLHFAIFSRSLSKRFSRLSISASCLRRTSYSAFCCSKCRWFAPISCASSLSS